MALQRLAALEQRVEASSARALAELEAMRAQTVSPVHVCALAKGRLMRACSDARCECEQGQCTPVDTRFQLRSGKWLADSRWICLLCCEEVLVSGGPAAKPVSALAADGPPWGMTWVMQEHLLQSMLTQMWSQASAAAEHAAERRAHAREVAELQAACTRAAAGQAAALQEAALLRKQARAAQEPNVLRKSARCASGQKPCACKGTRSSSAILPKSLVCYIEKSCWEALSCCCVVRHNGAAAMGR